MDGRVLLARKPSLSSDTFRGYTEHIIMLLDIGLIGVVG